MMVKKILYKIAIRFYQFAFAFVLFFIFHFPTTLASELYHFLLQDCFLFAPFMLNLCVCVCLEREREREREKRDLQQNNTLSQKRKKQKGTQCTLYTVRKKFSAMIKERVCRAM